MPSFSQKKLMRFIVTRQDRMQAMSRVCQPPKQFSIDLSFDITEEMKTTKQLMTLNTGAGLAYKS